MAIASPKQHGRTQHVPQQVADAVRHQHRQPLAHRALALKIAVGLALFLHVGQADVQIAQITLLGGFDARKAAGRLDLSQAYGLRTHTRCPLG